MTMKRLKKYWILLFTLLLTLTNTVIHSQATQDQPIKIEDSAQHTIEFKQPVTRIITLLPADAEILYAMGLGNLIVGRGEYVDYPADQVSDLPTVESNMSLNLEAIIALKPELVIAHQSTPSETIDQLAQAGIQTMCVDATDITGVYESIRHLGILTGHLSEADRLVTEMQNQFDAIRARADKHTTDKPASVYFEVSPLEMGLYTGGKHTFLDELAHMINLKNCFEDVNGWQAISQEQVIERQPDYIVSLTGSTDNPEILNEILSRKGWEQIPAIQQHRVLIADSNTFSRPGPRLVNALESLYEFAYGQE